MKKKKWRIGGFGVVSLPLMSLWLSIDGMCDANAPYEDIYVAHPQFFCSTGQIEFFCAKPTILYCGELKKMKKKHGMSFSVSQSSPPPRLLLKYFGFNFKQ